MSFDYPIIEEPATPEYVLDVLRDQHRQAASAYEADPDLVLSMETTVQEWCESEDLMDWQRLGRALNESWDLNIPDEEWFSALEPSREATLQEVCELLARYAVRPRIRPMLLLDRPCLPAGAFLTVRMLLQKAGADVSRITPSTEIESYAIAYPRVFTGALSRLAPRALPDVKVQYSGFLIGCSGLVVVSLPLYCLGICMGIAGLRFVGGALMVLGALSIACIRWLGPSKVTFGTLRTFRDLSYALCTEHRA